MTASLYESRLWQLCLLLRRRWPESMLRGILSAAGTWCCRQIEESRLLRPLCREGTVARAWPESILCRLMTALLSLPGTLLHRWRCIWPKTFAASRFAALALDMGDHTASAAFWCVACLWLIPYERWNNAYSLMAGSGLLLLFYAGSLGQRRRVPAVGRFGVYPLLVLLSAVLGVVFSYAPALSSRFLLYHLSAALLALMVLSAAEDGDDLRRLCAGAAVCVLGSGGYGIVQRLQGVKVNPSYVDLKVNAGMPGRVYSIFDNPNTFAQVLLLLLPFVLALMLTARTWRSRLFAAAAGAVGGAAMAMTYSRAAWVGLFCAMAVFVFLWRPGLIPAFAAACFAAIPFLPATIVNRILTITNTQDSSTASRTSLYRAALEVIRRSPLTGAGLGTETTQAYIREFNLYHDKAPFVHAHNFLLEVWIQMGLLGAVSFLSAMLWGIKTAGRAARRGRAGTGRTVAAAGAASLSGAMVCGLADYLWHYPRVQCIFWFAFAMALAGAKLTLREQAGLPPASGDRGCGRAARPAGQDAPPATPGGSPPPPPPRAR